MFHMVEKGQLTARDNFRSIEMDMVRPGTAALTMSEGVRDLQSSGRVGDLGVEDLSINSTFSRSVAPFCTSFVIMPRLTCQSWKAPFYCANYRQVRREQATKYVRLRIISIISIITIHYSTH